MPVSPENFRISSLMKNMTEPSESSLKLPHLRVKTRPFRESPKRLIRPRRNMSEFASPTVTPAAQQSQVSQTAEQLSAQLWNKDKDHSRSMLIRFCQRFLRELSQEKVPHSRILLAVWEVLEE
jgi:hypothetical protein